MRSLILLTVAGTVAACSSTKPDPFKPPTECSGATITPFQGTRQLLMSSIAIADAGEGFDLDKDGKKDNKLSALGVLANPELEKSFASSQDTLIAFELFGYAGEASTSCTKLAFYVGKYHVDRDKDGASTSPKQADCLDTDAAVRPGATENTSNRLDDDCDGFADNATRGTAPTDTQDLDGDGYTLAVGDCDDRNDTPEHLALAKTRHPGAMEVCADGIDQDCDGKPDNAAACDPFGQNQVSIDLRPESFQSATAMPLVPKIAFNVGQVKNNVLTVGPGSFVFDIPVKNDTLALELGGVQVQMQLQDDAAKMRTNASAGLLGGVLEARILQLVTGVSGGGVITEDQSLLDAIFVGPLATVLGLENDKDGHYSPDIDVDGDGKESFWSEAAPVAGQSLKIDTCKDGDGTVVKSAPGAPCALAKDKDGKYRFVDGISMALKFNAVPVKLSGKLSQ